MYTHKRNIKSARILMVFLCVAIINIGGAFAQTSAGFSVRAVIPDNQIDTKQTYFDLRMKPGEEQKVEIVIHNSRDEDLVAEVRLNTASTGRNGLIAYNEPNVRDELLKISITDIAALETENVTVPARGSKTVAINIKMPDEPIEGVILGGIAVTDGENESDAQTSQGVSLANKISYVIALKLTENDIEKPADFDLTSIKPELVNFKTAVVAKLQNKAARIVKGMDIKAQVFRKGSDTVLHELALGDTEMAPLSSGDYVIYWNNEPIGQGTYRLKMTAEYDGGIWEWDEEFTIGTEADDLNNNAVGLIKDYTWFYVLSGAVVLTLLLIFAYRAGKRSKTKESNGSNNDTPQ